ncbi:tripartite tricarboxylate transporter substrate binding protein [Ramlibacter terrae]|uniref:Tripartite tricarboxylate transporter substrate binding protein n=1 Tax=Ramlibacter terrae TaxID=2732511 RepID=A0ABX6P517_9BURK|nr:tripartite tricarboxylate transporter substrate binding protein [Ramlibacter terrae]
MKRRHVLAATAALLPAFKAAARSYPERPIRMVVPFPPGSSTDTLGREVAQLLAKRLDQSIVVDNKPGALATLGAAEVARAKPDGYTLFFGTSTSQAAAPSLFKKLSYDPNKDFAPIGRVGAVVFALVVRADLPVQSVQELIDHGLKKNPKPLAWGYANSANQVAASALVRHAKFDSTAVPYKGVPQIVVDMLGGRSISRLPTRPASCRTSSPGKCAPRQ